MSKISKWLISFCFPSRLTDWSDSELPVCSFVWIENKYLKLKWLVDNQKLTTCSLKIKLDNFYYFQKLYLQNVFQSIPRRSTTVLSVFSIFESYFFSNNQSTKSWFKNANQQTMEYLFNTISRNFYKKSFWNMFKINFFFTFL